MKKRGGRREGGKTAALEERRRKGNKKIKKEQGEGNNQEDKELRRERWRKSSVQNKWLNKWISQDLGKKDSLVFGEWEEKFRRVTAGQGADSGIPSLNPKGYLWSLIDHAPCSAFGKGQQLAPWAAPVCNVSAVPEGRGRPGQLECLRVCPGTLPAPIN